MLSVVIPVCNEAASLPALHQELVAMGDVQDIEMEWVFVDDGSEDETWATICALKEQDSRVKGVRLRRNFGKSAALTAGIAEASGEDICLIDGDGQDVPAEIPTLLKARDGGLDVVVGWRKNRADASSKIMASKIFNVMINLSTGMRLHDHNCGLKLLPRSFFDEVPLHTDRHRFIPLLARYRGYNVGEVPVSHRARMQGHTKYGLSRFFTGFLDLVVLTILFGHRGRPQHLLGILGLVTATVGALSLLWLAGIWGAQEMGLIPYARIASRPLTFYALASLLFGVQLLSLSAIAALVVGERRDVRSAYAVAERLDDSGKPEKPVEK